MLKVEDKRASFVYNTITALNKVNTSEAQVGKHRQVQEGSFHDISSTLPLWKEPEEGGRRQGDHPPSICQPGLWASRNHPPVNV